MLALNPLKWVNAFDVTGDYDMQTWVTLTGGTKWAFRLDGLITRACMSPCNCLCSSGDDSMTTLPL